MKNTFRAISITAGALIATYFFASILTGGIFTLEEMKTWESKNIVILVASYVGTALLVIVAHKNFEKDPKPEGKMPMRTSRR